jgi:hypothetical protein
MQQANQSFHYTTGDGVDHFVAKGDVVADKDPVVKGRDALFTTIPDLDKK